MSRGRDPWDEARGGGFAAPRRRETPPLGRGAPEPPRRAPPPPLTSREPVTEVL